MIKYHHLTFYQRHCTVPFAGGKTHLNTVNKKQCPLTDCYSDCVVCSAQNTELQQCITCDDDVQQTRHLSHLYK